MKSKKLLFLELQVKMAVIYLNFLLKKIILYMELLEGPQHQIPKRIDHLINDKNNNKLNSFNLLYGDLTDSLSIFKILELIRPDEVYNLAAQSHVKVSFEIPEYTYDVVGTGT